MMLNIRFIRITCNILFVAAALFSAVHARAFFSDLKALTSTQHTPSLPSLHTSVRTSKPSRSIIKFAVFGGKAKLYVNGKKQKTKSGLLKKVEVSLKKNDVVAFKCTKTGPSKMAGLMASITYNGKVYRTGVKRFSTRGDFSKWKTWEKKSWDKVKVYKDKKSGKTHGFCHWKEADKIASKWEKFDSSASFIWRLTKKNKKEVANSVFIRFVVGGEECSSEPKKSGAGEKDGDDDDDDDEDGKKKGGKDDDDDDDEGKGNKKGGKDDDDDDDGKGDRKKGGKDDDDDDDDDGKGDRKKGGKDDDDDDDDDGKGDRKKGGKDDDDDDDDDGKGDRKKGGKDDDDDDDGKGGKKKVDKDDDDDKGDDDKKPSGRVPHPKNDDDDDKKGKNGGGSQLGGQSDESKPDGFCACQLTTRRGGECYDMEDKTASSGRCTPRPCEPKFECVASGEKMCVKRRGGTKVVMVSPNNCMTETADDVEMLLPYEG